MTKSKILKEFDLFSLQTEGIGSWLTENTDDKVFQRLGKINEEPLTKVQFNQLLIFGHQRIVSNDFFQYYWLNTPNDHPYDVCKVPGFKQAWFPCDAIVSIDHLKWGLYRFFIDGLLWFGNVRTAYRKLTSMSDSNLITYFQQKKYNTEMIKKRGPALPLENIPKDDRFLISEMACKSYGDQPSTSGELLQGSETVIDNQVPYTYY